MKLKIALAFSLLIRTSAWAAIAPNESSVISFRGVHQAGIETPQQRYMYFAVFDLISSKREQVISALKAWTDASQKMMQGKPASLDSGEALELPAAKLTLTFGFGPGVFTKNGVDRYGLSHLRPEALVDLPKFNGDQLVEGKTGGDISVQACADDPQVAFHAVRQLARLATDVAQIRWAQTGFVASADAKTTPRNLMGFKDGTQQPKESERDQFVWVGPKGPEWMRGGSYQVVRRIRVALEHWDGSEVGFQEEVMGRYKYSGAPLGKKHEHDDLDLKRMDSEGNPVIAENAHVRLASAAENGGAQILRRGYSYNDGVDFTAERWPPWKQGMEYDAGLFFVAYQSDPRSGFIRIFERMAKFDALNQFATHVGSGIFACPPAPKKGEYIGELLFRSQS